MAEHESLPALMVQAWGTMFSTALRAALLFTYLSLPIVLAAVVLAPDALGFLIIALGMQTMMSAAYALHGAPESIEDGMEEIPLGYLLLVALLIGGSAQLVILGVPVLTGIYGGPVAGLVAALVFPFLDGKLNQWYKWLSPSVIMRYVTFRLLALIPTEGAGTLKPLEPRVTLLDWQRY